MNKKLLSLLLIVSFASAALAASRKGVQLVLLSRWSRTSCDNFLSVAKSPSAPTDIEIAFVPVFNRSNPYGNASYVVNALLGAGKRVTVAVHLSFKGDGALTDAQLEADAAAFNTGLFKSFANRVTFKLSPSLEDRWSSTEFQRRARLVATKLDWAILTSSTTNLQIRRSAETDTLALPNTLTVTKPGTTLTKSLILQREAHGYYGSASGYNAYSNDGVCVYADTRFSNGQYENASSCTNADPNKQPTKYTVTSFISGAASYPNAVLLWRPAYNLFTKSVSSAGYVTFQKIGDPYARSDAGAFDANEKEVLKRFLGVP
jgi:hypothetical protein